MFRVGFVLPYLSFGSIPRRLLHQIWIQLLEMEFKRPEKVVHIEDRGIFGFLFLDCFLGIGLVFPITKQSMVNFLHGNHSIFMLIQIGSNIVHSLVTELSGTCQCELECSQIHFLHRFLIFGHISAKKAHYMVFGHNFFRGNKRLDDIEKVTFSLFQIQNVISLRRNAISIDIKLASEKLRKFF